MGRLAFLFLIFTLQACAFFRPSPHNAMVQQLDAYVYPYSLAELKTKLLQEFPKLYSLDAPMIVFDSGRNFPPPAPSITAQNAMESGFTFEGKYYQNKIHEIDFSDFQGTDLPGHWKKKFHEMFFNNEFHLVKDVPEEFILVRSADIFIGKALGPKESRLEVKGAVYPIRGPLKLALQIPDKLWDLHWWDFLKIEKSPVVLEKTLQYAPDYPARALAVFYLLRPEEAEHWEKSFHK